MRILRTLSFAFALCTVALPASAQWQTPSHSVPIGKGGGVQGFGNAPVGTTGRVLTDNGPGVDPSFQVPATLGTVTSVGTQGGLLGGPITGSGALTLNGAYTGWGASNCTLAASVSGGLLTVSMKDNSGTDPSSASPCYVNYRSDTLGVGSTVLTTQTGALSINTNAVGATLGTSNNQAFRLWVVSFNNAGVNTLALINCSNSTSVFSLNESIPASSVPVSGSATAAGTFYTSNGTTVTNRAFRILGYVEYNAAGLPTAGTYSSVPSVIQVFGPGTKKPGDVVQARFISVDPVQASTGAVQIATGLSSSLALTSSANLIRVRSSVSSSATAGAASIVQLYWSTSSFACSNTIGRDTTASGGGSTTWNIGQTSIGWALPNTASQIFIGLCLGTTGGNVTISGGTLEFDEIMG